MRKKILFAVLVMFGAGCKTPPPNVTHCVIDNNIPGAWCAKAGEEPYAVALEDLDTYIARSSEDERALVEWIKRTCRKSGATVTAGGLDASAR